MSDPLGAVLDILLFTGTERSYTPPPPTAYEVCAVETAHIRPDEALKRALAECMVRLTGRDPRPPTD